MKPNIRQLLLRIKTLGSTIGISPIILLLFSAASGCKEQQPKQARVIDISLYRLRAPEGGNLWAMDNDTIAPDIPVGQRGLITNFKYHFIFHDSLGNITKVVYKDSFPTRNPILKLNFPRNGSTAEPAYNYLGDFALFSYWDSKPHQIVQVLPKPEIRREFAKLKRYGIFLDNPDAATRILGTAAGYRHFKRSPNRKFLCVAEDASIINDFTEEPERFDENGVLLGDAMFDCSTLSVYDHSGKMIKEYLLPGKNCSYNFGISNDGRFVFVGYFKTARSADGYGSGKGGYCMIDLYSNTLEEINDRDLPVPDGNAFDEIVFAQDFFRFYNRNSHKDNSQYYYYINPYKKIIYEPLKVPKQTHVRYFIYEDIFEPRRGYRMDTLHRKQLPYYKY